MKRVLIILLPLIFFSCDSNTGKKPPKWTHSIDESDIIIQSVGIAENKNESILNALIELSNLIQTQIETQIIETQIEDSVSGFSDSSHFDFTSSILKTMTVQTFGKVEVSGTFTELQNESGVYETKAISQMSYNSDNKSMLYKRYYSNVEKGKKSSIQHHFEIFEENCTLKGLIDELINSGCNFEFYSNNDNYYTLIGYEKKRLLENIYK